MNANEGIIYVLTNKAMPNYIKIGKTCDLNRRLNELFNTSVPCRFEVYCAFEIENYSKIEQKIHSVFADYRDNKDREFFTVSPDKVYTLLSLLPSKEVTRNYETTITENAFVEKRSRLKFNNINIPIGSTLYFIKDEKITCKVVSADQVEYENIIQRLSPLTNTILHNKFNASENINVQGGLYWGYKEEGSDIIENIIARRNRLEEQ
jgi:hypothetical protein